MIVTKYDDNGEPSVFARRGETLPLTIAQFESLSGMYVLTQVEDPDKKSDDHDNDKN